MQPQPVMEKHLIFKPKSHPPGSRPTGPTGAVQGVSSSQVQALQAHTQGDLFYLQLVAEIDPTTATKGNGDEMGGDDEAREGVSKISHP